MRIIALNHHRSDNRIDKDRSDSGWSSSYLKHLLKILSFSTFPWLQNCTKYLMFSRPGHHHHHVKCRKKQKCSQRICTRNENYFRVWHQLLLLLLLLHDSSHWIYVGNWLLGVEEIAININIKIAHQDHFVFSSRAFLWLPLVSRNSISQVDTEIWSVLCALIIIIRLWSTYLLTYLLSIIHIRTYPVAGSIH